MAHSVAIRNGQSSCDEKGLSNFAIAFLSPGGGVVGAGDCLVQAQSSPNNTVKVNPGRAYVPTSDGSMVYATYLDISQNVTIASNNSGNPRIDTIVLYIDLSASPDAGATNVAKFYDVQGTPAASPTPPSNSAILAAIGASNPYIPLANIAVANSFTSINASNITDARTFASLSKTGDATFQGSFSNFVASGITIPTSATLTTSSTAGILYYGGNKVFVASDGGHTYTASKDTYVDVSSAGVYTYLEVANGAGAPALTPNSLRVAKVVTNASAVTAVVQAGADSNGMPIYPHAPTAKATGSDIDTGTDDSKTVTSKAIADSLIQSGWTPARETWTYVSADDPTYTFKISGVDLTGKYSPGMRIKLTQNTGGTKYFIITAVAFSTDTTITVYGGTDYDLNNEAISSPYYSTQKAPQGFPMDATKWTVITTDQIQRGQNSPTAGTWYNPKGAAAITVPIGSWHLSWSAVFGGWKNSTTSVTVNACLSTTNNSQSDGNLGAFTKLEGASGNLFVVSPAYREKRVTVASKTAYYLNLLTSTASMGGIAFYNDSIDAVVQAVCAYL